MSRGGRQHLQLLGTLVLIALTFSIVLGPVFLYLLILIVYASLYLAFYVLVSFVFAVLEAWTAGAALYGLLLLMRSAGRVGQRNADDKLKAPPVVRLVV